MSPVTIGLCLVLLSVTVLSGDASGVPNDPPYSANKDAKNTLHDDIASKVKANVEKSLSTARDEYISKHGLEGLLKETDPTLRGVVDSIINNEIEKDKDDKEEVAENLRGLKEMILADIVNDRKDDSRDDERSDASSDQDDDSNDATLDEDPNDSNDSSRDEEDSDNSTSEGASTEDYDVGLDDVANVLVGFLEQKLKSLHELETAVKGKIRNGAERHEERVAAILDHVWDKLGVALNHSKVLRENLKLLKNKIVSELKKYRWEYENSDADDDDSTSDSNDDSDENDNDDDDYDNDVLESIVDYFKANIRAKIIKDWDSENSDSNDSDISEDDHDESENNVEESSDEDWLNDIRDVFKELEKKVSYDKTKSLLENLKGVRERVISGLKNLEELFGGKSYKSNESESASENEDDSNKTFYCER